MEVALNAVLEMIFRRVELCRRWRHDPDHATLVLLGSPLNAAPWPSGCWRPCCQRQQSPSLRPIFRLPRLLLYFYSLKTLSSGKASRAKGLLKLPARPLAASASSASKSQPPLRRIVSSACGSDRSATSSPRTSNVRPLMFRAASVHSQTTNGEILRGGNSSASNSNFLAVPGTGPMVSVISCSQGRDFSAKSVVDMPTAKGRIALQRMPNRPTSMATVRVKPITPSREEAWAIDPG